MSRAPRSKQAIRERIWSLFTERGVARFPGAVGRIPNFIGAEAAAEFALLTELGLIGPWTTVATTVHQLQIVRPTIPMLGHDIPLDLIATPDEAIACPRHHARPTGIIWSTLPEEKIDEIPVLARLTRARRR